MLKFCNIIAIMLTLSNFSIQEVLQIYHKSQELSKIVVTEPQEQQPHKEQEQEQPQSPVFSITAEERDTLAKLVYLEANVESLECKKAIVSVVFNRMYSPYWGTTVNKVIYAKNQFSPANRISSTTATQECYDAVDYIIQNGCTIPPYVLYFRANYYFSWATNYQKIDKTCFSYQDKDKKDYESGKWN